MNTRLVGYGGMAFTLVAALVLSGVVARSPQTHDHISNAARDDYSRTALDDVKPVDLEWVLAELPGFSFPSPTRTTSEASGHTAGMHDEGGDESVPTGGDAAAEQSEVQRITVRQSEFELDPSRVELRVGVPVELTVVNEGGQVHGLWIPDFAISEDIRSGKSKVFTFTPEKTGRIRFTCSYNLCGTEEEHARMVGFLTVA